MKQLFSILIVVLLLTLSGCGSSSSGSSVQKSSTPSEQAALAEIAGLPTSVNDPTDNGGNSDLTSQGISIQTVDGQDITYNGSTYSFVSSSNVDGEIQLDYALTNDSEFGFLTLTTSTDISSTININLSISNLSFDIENNSASLTMSISGLEAFRISSGNTSLAAANTISGTISSSMTDLLNPEPTVSMSGALTYNFDFNITTSAGTTHEFSGAATYSFSGITAEAAPDLSGDVALFNGDGTREVGVITLDADGVVVSVKAYNENGELQDFDTLLQ